jgi:hypothetical protein
MIQSYFLMRLTLKSQHFCIIVCTSQSSMAYSPLLGPGLVFSFLIFFGQSVDFLGRVIIPTQGRYLHTGQNKHRINPHTDMPTLSVVRTHEPSLRPRKDSSCLRPCGQSNRLFLHRYTRCGNKETGFML